jgi:sodium transport system permease protein
MNWRTIRVILNHELLMLLRDRRTVLLAIILPVLIMPIMLFGSRYMFERREKSLEATTYQYAVTGSEAELVRSMISKAEQLPKETVPEDGASEQGSLVEVQVEDPRASLEADKIHFYLQGLSGAEADALHKQEVAEREASASGREQEDRAASEPARIEGVPLIRIFFRGNSDVSEAGRSRIRELLLSARKAEREDLLRREGFQGDPDDVFPIEDTNIASAGQVTGSLIGRFLTLFILMFMLMGGSVVAMDIVAGEKERGSLETLLTTAAKREEIVTAKQFAILAVALVITLIQVANILIYLNLKVIELPQDWMIEVPPLTIVTLLFLFIPFAAFFAAVLLMLSAYAKSYKEAQLYFFPVYLVSLIPALAAVLPGISLRSAIAIIPVANVSVAAREIMVGTFDWPMLAIACAAMWAAAIWAIRASAKMLSQENLITASEIDAADLAGGPALFPKHVLRWYAVMGVGMFAIALNVPQLSTMRSQILFNELVIFLAIPLLMIRWYGLDFRAALALRPVRPLAWLAALLMIPSANIVGVGVFRLANLFLPVPERVLEDFGRSIIPEGIPIWQLIFFIAVLPGICEELAFRGTLLYGLHRRFRPIALAIIIGVIFGFFHTALFRILPTAFLGVLLTALALLTGSVFPGILVHAGSNAMSVLFGEAEIPLHQLGWWIYLAASAVLGLSFYILYRVRTPYPNLRN